MELMTEKQIPVRRESEFVLGLDLGQTQDPTAISVLEKIVEGTGEWTITPDKVSREKSRTRFELRHLERLPLETTYPAQVEYVASLMAREPLARNGELVIDQTGVGRPIFDLFASAGLRPIGVSITGGESESCVSSTEWHVSKLRLVSRLQVLLHSEDLKIAAKLPDAAALVNELQNFKTTFTTAGNALFAARSGKHNDLVLSLAIAAWWACRPRFQPRMIKVVGL